MPDVLIEIGCEELPSSACREAIAQAPRLLADALEALHLPAGEVVAWVAPRRIAVFAPDVADRQSGEAKAVRGPAIQAAYGDDGAPTKAAEGFARGQGVDVAELATRPDPESGRDFVWVDKAGEDAPLVDLMSELARRVLEGLRFGKTMRWCDGSPRRRATPRVCSRSRAFLRQGRARGTVFWVAPSMSHRPPHIAMTCARYR